VKHLLDVNILLAAVVDAHPQHVRALTWLTNKKIVLCPVSELGFIRIGTHKRAYALPMERVRAGLEKFASERKVERIADDLPALESHSRSSEEVTDHYLADLAAKHGLKLATFDQDLAHPAAEIVR
jgi:toxin-antitoxin system PIN domain toxin